MSRTLWDTTGTDVVKSLAAERRASGSVSSGLALTLAGVTFSLIGDGLADALRPRA